MEKIIKKLLIIGCGKLGQRIGKNLAGLPIEIVGITMDAATKAQENSAEAVNAAGSA